MPGSRHPVRLLPQTEVPMIRRLALMIALFLACPFAARADNHPSDPTVSAANASLFDPTVHMRVSEVRPGMQGYGLTVFSGTKIEKFDVEVLSVLKNFNPKSDVVLIRCKGEYLKHTGSIAGMSGSPIYLKDDAGRYRMIGAFAYGWPLTKDPVAGVQPIEYMLKIPVGRNPNASVSVDPATQPSRASSSDPVRADGHAGFSWSMSNAGLVPFWNSPGSRGLAERSAGLSAGSRLGEGASQLEPLATPLMAGGLSPSLLKQVAPLFQRYGLTALQAGGGGSAPDNQSAAKLEPGSALAVPLLTGDVDLTAIGTVTETIGDRVFGFGHPFNNEGFVHLPMGSGVINGVIANLQTSFKLGALTKERGELTTDESVGVAGRVGEIAPTVPIEFHLTYADGTAPRVYRFNSAQHPKFTPMIAGVALAAAITGPSELPQYNTLNYNMSLQFANGQTVEISDTAVNANPQDLFNEIALPLTAASENPFERVPIRKISGNIHISGEARQAQILDVNVPRSRYRPGETVKAFVTYKSFRGAEGILPMEIDLPRDLAEGTYQLIISDAQRYFQDMQQSEPFRFTADNIKDVFGVLKDVAAIRQNAVYLRLLRQPDGVAVGRAALPNLPSSRRQLLLGAGRSNITPFVSSKVKVVPTEMVINGSAEFAITIDSTAKVEVANSKPAKAEPAAAPLPAAKPGDHRKAASTDSPTPPEEAKPSDQPAQ
jgi:hypothetical protein